MNARFDDWGRDRDRALPVPMQPTKVAVETDLLAEMAALRTRLLDIEARVVECVGVQVPVIAGAEWTRRLALAVADHWDISVVELVGRTRVQVVIRPRFALCWLLQKTAGYSTPRIATLVGYDDHTSVIHALRRVDDWRTSDEAFAWSLEQLLGVAQHLRRESLAALPGAPVPEAVA